MARDRKEQVSDLMRSFELVCKTKGLRITHQRSEIFRELTRDPGHPTAERVFSAVRKRLKTISLDTVYRTITTFEKYDLVRRVQIIDGTARFDINLAIHHHLVCTRCDKIEDFYWPELDRLKLPESITGWPKIDSRHVEIRGLCHDCKMKPGK